MHKRFEHSAMEQKWQKRWKADGIYKTDSASEKPKAYVLDMFPYPSGEGLHVGHPKGYIATDIYSRFKRMTGYEVLHPMGWDAFGLPAENFAIKNKVHPRSAVDKNVARFKEQLEILGFDYDWSREINTTDPEFYKWTQWIFIQLFKRGLAYQSNEPINWCPGCQTGLANEDLNADGTCERCDSVVEKRPMRQWVLNIRAYADRMLEDLDTLNWPEHIKEAQRNWIGRSTGAEIDFKLKGNDSNSTVNRTITVFTTRPDTLYGATYLVVAPEHPLIAECKDSITNYDEVATYVLTATQKDEQDRLDVTKEKTGVRLEGIATINPANNEVIPVYVADYVLGDYGTGAIMAVPAHDERDNEFAKKFRLPIKVVVKSDNEFKDINQQALVELTIELFALSRENDFKLVLVGGAAYKLLTEGKFGTHSDIDVFTDEKGFEIINNHLVQKQFHVADRNGAIEHHEWNDQKWYWRDGVWLDVFKLHCEEDTYFDLVGKEKNVWGDKSIFERKQFNNSEIITVKKDVLDTIDFNLSHCWNHCYTDAGVLKNSGEFTGMNSEEAKEAIVKKVGGRMTNTYKIKDWVFSRQRYWGEPFPIVHTEDGKALSIAFEQLPVTLPEVQHYEPAGDGQSPLANITEWVSVTGYVNEAGDFVVSNTAPEGKTLIKAKRETNTMPQWAGSSWYYLRYIDPNNNQELIDPIKEKKWQPVDVYVGGDHAVRHLIYARFWHKFLYDIGTVSTIEPFQRLEFLGFILAEDGRKMSKRWGNVINPDDIVALVGADTLRVYEMFMGPFENTIAWSQDGLVGARRFLERVHGLSEHVTEAEPEETLALLHKTIKKVGEDIEDFKFNTAISAMMIFINQAEKAGLSQVSYELFLKLLAPFAPHLTEELWSQTHQMSIHCESYPQADAALAIDTTVTIGVQINGKLRGSITIPVDANEAEALTAAREEPMVAAKLDGVEVKKVIYVAGRILNLIV